MGPYKLQQPPRRWSRPREPTPITANAQQKNDDFSRIFYLGNCRGVDLNDANISQIIKISKISSLFGVELVGNNETNFFQQFWALKHVHSEEIKDFSVFSILGALRPLSLVTFFGKPQKFSSSKQFQVPDLLKDHGEDIKRNLQRYDTCQQLKNWMSQGQKNTYEVN